MGVIRVEKTKNYTVMSNYHLKDRNLSLKAQGLLSIILSLPDDWDYSVAGLVTIVKDGKSAVQSALRELEENDYVVRRRIKDDKGRILDWEYIIFENPNDNNIPEDERKSISSPPTDFQEVGNRDVDFRDVDGMSQPNTKKPNTKEKAPAEPALSSIKSRRRDMISRSINTLDDSLESGKDIDKYEKSKKKSKSELEKEECLALFNKYDDNIRDLLIEYFSFASDRKQADRENKDKVTSKPSIWEGKLKNLDNLVKEGYDCEKLIRQSLENRKYKFYPLATESNVAYKNNINVTADINDTKATKEQIKYLLDNDNNPNMNY